MKKIILTFSIIILFLLQTKTTYSRTWEEYLSNKVWRHQGLGPDASDMVDIFYANHSMLRIVIFNNGYCFEVSGKYSINEGVLKITIGTNTEGPFRLEYENENKFKKYYNNRPSYYAVFLSEEDKDPLKFDLRDLHSSHIQFSDKDSGNGKSESYNEQKRCGACGGTGRCRTCYGLGYIDSPYSTELRTCSGCKGTGDCPYCDN